MTGRDIPQVKRKVGQPRPGNVVLLDDDLTAFLAARYDEAEASARAEGESRIAWLTYRRDDGSMDYTTVADGHAGDGWVADGKVLPEPASVLLVYETKHRLADIALKRAILAMYANTAAIKDECERKMAAGEQLDEIRSRDYLDAGRELAALEPVVRQLGTEFSEHDDYKQAWQPEES